MVFEATVVAICGCALDDEPTADASCVVVRCLVGERSGRANDAVDDKTGVACDEEITAGTEADLIIFARRLVRSATFISTGTGFLVT